MKFLIIDDDQHFCIKLNNALKNSYPDSRIDVINQFDKSLDYDFDIVFLDILLNKDNGVDCAHYINGISPKSLIVFISMHDNLIFDTQEVNNLCFIRKSNFENDYELFLRCFSKYCQSKSYISISSNRTEYKLNTEDIIYFESSNHIIDVVTFKGIISVRASIEYFSVLHA